MYIPIKKIMPDTLQKDAGLFCACGEGMEEGAARVQELCKTGSEAIFKLHLTYT